MQYKSRKNSKQWCQRHSQRHLSVWNRWWTTTWRESRDAQRMKVICSAQSSHQKTLYWITWSRNQDQWIEVNVNHVVVNVIFCWESYRWSKCFANTQKNIKQSEMWTLMFQQKKLRILQYNVHKFRNKMMIVLLHEKKIKNYDILILQKFWWFDDIFRAYCSVTVNFMLKNNEDKICFYINKRINSNIWYSTWHFKDVNTITLQTLTNNAQMIQKAIHIHEAYNLSLRDHEIIHEKENLSDIEKTLQMSKESILVENFNLHHFTWEESFYSRQHLLLNELIEMITNINASLALSQDTITRNYQESQMTINLIFTTESITNRLIQCKINEEMKNFSDHLLIQIVIDFRVCKKSAQRSRCNWKTMNEEKFINILKEQMLKSLLNQKTRRQRIKKYTKQLLNALKKITEIFTFWVRSHEMIKAEWMKKCTEIIKSMQWMRRDCQIVDDWVEYIQACNKKSKIIRKQKCSEYWKIMQNVEQFSRELFQIMKWARNVVTDTLT